ncbi:DUF4870 domain-containing protein [Endozoicomonas ascidiicola]|uniref:DUF4870 domain-containing protein n=1 Tax=Endozoicomonas ascidiicola TaxID=1698521 RepID=UPI0008325CEE|nr:DUF4870 domain-containing protein [Endozoicomonas ascidiicola]
MMKDSEFPPVNSPSINRDDKNMAVLSHLLPLFGFMVPGLSIVIPLLIWLWKRDSSPYIEHHARESLNFQITLALLIAVWVALKLMLVGFLLLPLVPIIAIVVLIFMVRAAMKAGNGEFYRYPMTLRLVN